MTNRFGIMLDLSRNAVMKVEQIKRFIDCMQKMDYNCLELYMEDVYEIKGEPYFGYLRGRYTKEELKEIDDYASAKGIEVIPSIQVLAHFTCLAKQEVYKNIVDLNDILLIDEPKTYELIDKMFLTLKGCFKSPNVNIGMDEAHMVGLGKYLSKHGYQNRIDILLNHLNKVSEIGKKYGYTMHMWSDMFYRLLCDGAYHPRPVPELPKDLVERIPENVELVYWDYYTTEEDYYDQMFTSHKNTGRNVWYAGGMHCWWGFAPQNWKGLETIKTALPSVNKNGINNVLITLWGDDGGECSYFTCLHVLYELRQYSKGNYDKESIEKGFYQLFGVGYQDFTLLDLPNKTVKDYIDEKGRTRPQNPSKTLFYNDVFLGVMDKVVKEEPPIPYIEYANKLEQASKRAGEFNYIFSELSKLCLFLSIKSDLGVRTRTAYKEGNKKELKKLVKDYKKAGKLAKEFYNAFSILWHKENKGQGWEVQDARIGGVIMRIESARQRLKDYLKGNIDKIEELEEEILTFRENLYYNTNSYERLISSNAVV